jgi:hypothetical protein
MCNNQIFLLRKPFSNTMAQNMCYFWCATKLFHDETNITICPCISFLRQFVGAGTIGQTDGEG